MASTAPIAALRLTVGPRTAVIHRDRDNRWWVRTRYVDGYAESELPHGGEFTAHGDQDGHWTVAGVVGSDAAAVSVVDRSSGHVFPTAAAEGFFIAAVQVTSTPQDLAVVADGETLIHIGGL